MEGTLLKKDGKPLGSACANWVQSCWMVDAVMAFDHAWMVDYDEEAPYWLGRLIEDGYLCANEVDSAMSKWLNRPWPTSRGGGKFIFAASLLTVVNFIAWRNNNTPLSRRTLCDNLPAIIAWTRANPCCKSRRSWVDKTLLGAVLNLPERQGRYTELFREILFNVEPGNVNYFAVVFGQGGKWDSDGAVHHLHRFGQMLRRRRQARINDLRKWGCSCEEIQRITANNDEFDEKRIFLLFLVKQSGIVGHCGHFVIDWQKIGGKILRRQEVAPSDSSKAKTFSLQ